MGICEDESRKSRSDLLPDKLVAVHWHFPNLVSVAVQGTVLPPDTLDILVSLPSLRTLDLGAHTTFPLSSLLNFIRAAPSLHNLRPPPPRLVWRKGFGLEDAKALIGACVEKGVAVAGTIRKRCAAALLVDQRLMTAAAEGCVSIDLSREQDEHNLLFKQSRELSQLWLCAGKVLDHDEGVVDPVSAMKDALWRKSRGWSRCRDCEDEIQDYLTRLQAFWEVRKAKISLF
ncbi:hypothetical protein JCM10449v2_005260 [Rhodotorula kratochvilovae]